MRVIIYELTSFSERKKLQNTHNNLYRNENKFAFMSCYKIFISLYRSANFAMPIIFLSFHTEPGPDWRPEFRLCTAESVLIWQRWTRSKTTTRRTSTCVSDPASPARTSITTSKMTVQFFFTRNYHFWTSSVKFSIYVL